MLDLKGTIDLSACLSISLSVILVFGLFLAMLLDLVLKLGSKLPYKELQIKYDLGHNLPTALRVIALYSIMRSDIFSLT